MKDTLGREYPEDAFEYDRVATLAEVYEIPRDEAQALAKEARISPVMIDEYGEQIVIINRVAYIIEPYEDDTH